LACIGVLIEAGERAPLQCNGAETHATPKEKVSHGVRSDLLQLRVSEMPTKGSQDKSVGDEPTAERAAVGEIVGDQAGELHSSLPRSSSAT